MVCAVTTQIWRMHTGGPMTCRPPPARGPAGLRCRPARPPAGRRTPPPPPAGALPPPLHPSPPPDRPDATEHACQPGPSDGLLITRCCTGALPSSADMHIKAGGYNNAAVTCSSSTAEVSCCSVTASTWRSRSAKASRSARMASTFSLATCELTSTPWSPANDCLS